MLLSESPDFRPLLPPGLHAMTLEEVYQLTVAHPRFGLSRSRAILMRGLWILVGCLSSVGIRGKLWVDGSFVTEKIDPADIDIVVCIEAGFLDTASEGQLGVLDWLGDPPRRGKPAPPEATFGCHTFVVFETNPDHPNHEELSQEMSGWQKFFGHDRQNQPKGMIEIAIPGGRI
jgi:hypothetical protein